MEKRKVNVGLFGYRFMGKAHSNAYRQASRFYDLEWEPVLKCLCGRDEDALAAAAQQFGFEEIDTDWRRVVERSDIDLVDVSTPGHMHMPIAIAAAEAGKIVWCEKPLANSLDEARQMHEAVEAAGVANMVFHNYRFCPAVALAREMVRSGSLGKIYHFRAVYLQDWIADKAFPLVWRLQSKFAGSGALGDIAAHSIDLARLIVGEISEVCGDLKTFIKERPLASSVDSSLGAAASSEVGEVDVDDAALFLARFECGAVGTFEASRFATGRKNYNRFEVNGSLGSIAFNLERMNELEYYNAEDPEGFRGFRVIQATEAVHPYAGAWWPPGHIIGYEHTFTNQVAYGFGEMAKGNTLTPSFLDGLKNQAVLDAVSRSSEKRAWQSITPSPTRGREDRLTH